MVATIAVDYTTNAPAWPPRTVDGVDATVVGVWLRCRTEVGTWPSDVTIGLPLMAWSMAPRPTVEQVQATVRVQVEAVSDQIDNVVVTATGGETIAATIAYEYTDDDGTTSVVISGLLYPSSGLPNWTATTRGVCR